MSVTPSKSIGMGIVQEVMDKFWSQTEFAKKFTPFYRTMISAFWVNTTLDIYKAWLDAGKAFPLEDIITTAQTLIVSGSTALTAVRRHPRSNRPPDLSSAPALPKHPGRRPGGRGRRRFFTPCAKKRRQSLSGLPALFDVAAETEKRSRPKTQGRLPRRVQVLGDNVLITFRQYRFTQPEISSGGTVQGQEEEGHLGGGDRLPSPHKGEVEGQQQADEGPKHREGGGRPHRRAQALGPHHRLREGGSGPPGTAPPSVGGCGAGRGRRARCAAPPWGSPSSPPGA